MPKRARLDDGSELRLGDEPRRTAACCCCSVVAVRREQLARLGRWLCRLSALGAPTVHVCARVAAAPVVPSQPAVGDCSSCSKRGDARGTVSGWPTGVRDSGVAVVPQPTPVGAMGSSSSCAWGCVGASFMASVPWRRLFDHSEWVQRQQQQPNQPRQRKTHGRKLTRAPTFDPAGKVVTVVGDLCDACRLHQANRSDNGRRDHGRDSDDGEQSCGSDDVVMSSSFEGGSRADASGDTETGETTAATGAVSTAVCFRRLWIVFEAMAEGMEAHRVWSLLLHGCLLRAARLDAVRNWLSTVGGAHAQLGTRSAWHARNAVAYAIRMFNVAIELGNDTLASHCCVYVALGRLQLGDAQGCRLVLGSQVISEARNRNDAEALRLIAAAEEKLAAYVAKHPT
eukprot:m.82981 g.82981  ORF g.82981 m.82981 type:complete len:398 (-) comp14747_c0_seq5:56-1249(-)